MANRVITMRELVTHAARNRCIPKKVGAQERFRAKCPNHANMRPFLVVALMADEFQMRDTASPMQVYRTVQTGPKILSGGFQDGRDILRYHPPGLVADATKGTGDAPPTTCPTTHQVDGGRAANDKQEEDEACIVCAPPPLKPSGRGREQEDATAAV